MFHVVRAIVVGILFAACANAGEALGSPKFVPSLEHPFGWRGDGTGRYPSATPPTTWSRRVVSGATAGARYQARKPKGEGEPSDAPRLEVGIVKDWLVLGPFATETPAEDIEKSLIGDEAALAPDEGDKINLKVPPSGAPSLGAPSSGAPKSGAPSSGGTLAWKFVHASIDTQSTHYTNEGTCQDYNVDFVFLYGQINNQLAYAHTYIWSPNGGDALFSLHRAGAAGRFWLNGKPVTLNPKDWSNIHKSNVKLEKGWNRLLVKLSAGESTRPEGQNAWISKWRFSIYFSAPLPATYESKNIAWMTRLPGFSASPPVVCGDRLFATCGTSDLICINKRDGKVEWLTTLTPLEALSDADKADPQFKEKVEPLVAQVKQFDETLVKEINAVNAVAGVAKEPQAKLDKLIKDKHDTERKMHDALKAIDRKRFPPMYENEVAGTNGTPVTDGKRVYVGVGGGMKGPGGYVIAAYELDGKRAWSFHEALGAPEHGTHTSPAIVDGKLIYGAQYHLLAFEPATGTIAWRVQLPRSAQGCSACTFIPANEGGVNVLITHPVQTYRAADGKLLSEIKNNNLDFFAGETTPLFEGKNIFVNGSVFKKAFLAFDLPDSTGGPPKLAWKLEANDWRLENSSQFSIASSLIVNGLLYCVDTMGGLSVIDLNAKKLAYKRRLEMFQRADRQHWGFTASPALGGKNIYIFDNMGAGLVLAPGPQYKEVAKNIIENQVTSAWQDYKQELFYASPVFDGNAMYLKGAEYLYCVREK